MTIPVNEILHGDVREKLSELPDKCKAEFKAGIVLDPFFGAGTTGVAARNLGRNFIGIEINKEYVEMAEERVKPLVEQKTLEEIL